MQADSIDAKPETLLRVASELMALAESLRVLAGHDKTSVVNRSGLLNPPRIAEELGVAPETVRSWIRDGHLVAVKLCRKAAIRPRMHVTREELERFLESRRIVKDAKPEEPAPRRPAKKVYRFF